MYLTTSLLPIAFISNHLKSQQIGERKIDVNATKRHAPSTGAQFGVSGTNISQHTTCLTWANTLE